MTRVIVLLAIVLVACGEKIPDFTPSACAASYEPSFDASALLGPQVLPPCEGETEATCRVQRVDVNGEARCYVYNVPESPPTGRPLVIVWHGSSSNGERVRQAMNADFDGLRLEDAIGGEAMVIYPDGRTHRDCKRNTCWDRDPEGPDLAFFDALVDHAETKWGIDREAVFSVGHSRGGRFVEVLGCFRAQRHVAVSMISAGSNNVDDCPGSVPIWLSHGVDDEWVSIRHGEKHLKNWASRNGCELGDIDAYPNDTCTPLSGCQEAVHWCPTTVEEWSGHAPPSIADEAMWSFFKSQLP